MYVCGTSHIATICWIGRAALCHDVVVYDDDDADDDDDNDDDDDGDDDDCALGAIEHLFKDNVHVHVGRQMPAVCGFRLGPFCRHAHVRWNECSIKPLCGLDVPEMEWRCKLSLP